MRGDALSGGSFIPCGVHEPRLGNSTHNLECKAYIICVILTPLKSIKLLISPYAYKFAVEIEWRPWMVTLRVVEFKAVVSLRWTVQQALTRFTSLQHFDLFSFARTFRCVLVALAWSRSCPFWCWILQKITGDAVEIKEDQENLANLLSCCNVPHRVP